MNGSQQQQQKQSQSQSQPPNQKKAPEQEKLRRNSDISLSKSDYTSTTSTSTSSITSESPDSLAYQNQPTPPTINPTATTSATGEITNSNTGNKRTEDLRHVYANPATTILTTTVEGATRTGDKNNNTNNKPKQPILLRPKVQVLSIQAKAVVNEHHSRPANPAVLTAIAPIPRVVRPAPLKNNGTITIPIPNKINTNTTQVARLKKLEDEKRAKYLRDQQKQQQQQREAAARQRQQDQCNFPITNIHSQGPSQVPSQTQPQPNPNNHRATNKTNHNTTPGIPRSTYTMGSNPNQHSSQQVQIMNQPQQNYVLRPITHSSTSSSNSNEKALLLQQHDHNNTNNNLPPPLPPPESSLDSSNHTMSTSHTNLNTNNNNLIHHHPTPLFERLVTEEVQEIKTYIRIVETLNRRLSDMQSVQDDLELRLEQSTKQKLNMERQLEKLNTQWVQKCSHLEDDRDTWMKRCGEERGRNERLSNLVNRKDKEIQRMIQRKYDSAKSSHHSSHMKRSESARATSTQQQTTSTSSSKTHAHMMQGISPHDILVERGSGDAIRERNVIHSLMDFFGM